MTFASMILSKVFHCFTLFWARSLILLGLVLGLHIQIFAKTCADLDASDHIDSSVTMSKASRSLADQGSSELLATVSEPGQIAGVLNAAHVLLYEMGPTNNVVINWVKYRGPGADSFVSLQSSRMTPVRKPQIPEPANGDFGLHLTFNFHFREQVSIKQFGNYVFAKSGKNSPEYFYSLNNTILTVGVFGEGEAAPAFQVKLTLLGEVKILTLDPRDLRRVIFLSGNKIYAVQLSSLSGTQDSTTLRQNQNSSADAGSNPVQPVAAASSTPPSPQVIIPKSIYTLPDSYRPENLLISFINSNDEIIFIFKDQDPLSVPLNSRTQHNKLKPIE